VEKVAQKVARKISRGCRNGQLPVMSDEARSYGIMLTPGVVINDKVFSSGKMISELELESAVKRN